MRIALVGNQNAGKTTLFNALTGANQKIGNWPGVTIERKEGYLKGHKDITVVDLPGVYSLSPYTSEEDVSRKFVLNEKVDLILNIIDATSLERSLYLTTQLLELDSDVLIALNMADILESNGIELNIKNLEDTFSTSVVSISARTGLNIDKLINVIAKKSYLKNSHIKIYDQKIEDLISKISNTVLANTDDNKIFRSVKIIEKDIDFNQLSNEETTEEIDTIEQEYEMDSEQLIASQRYDFITKEKSKFLIIHPYKESITDKLDRVFLNKYAAIPLFLVIIGFVYFLSVGLVGQLTSGLITAAFDGSKTLELFGNEIPFAVEGLKPILESSLSAWGAHQWAISMLNDGIITGIAAVLNFLPQIVMLFFCLTILEATGYMSRIAFFLDRVFHKIGLSGKSLIPFIVGSGCSVPGIMSSRIVEDEDERHLTILLTPFIPCSAKLPIISLITGVFFGKYAWIAAFGIYVMAVGLIMLSGYILKKFKYKGHQSTFVSELPQYKLPNMKYVGRDVYDKTYSFIKRAGTVILLCSFVVWLFASFTWDFRYVDGVNVLLDQSILAGIGNAFGWVFYIMLGGHYSWGASVSAIQGIVAKEQVISSLSVISSLNGYSGPIFSSPAFAFMNGWSAFAYMVFNLFCSPCIGAISAMKKEYGSLKYALLGIAFQTSVAWFLATLIGGIGWAITSI
jgi:ferrous iron transport protein B